MISRHTQWRSYQVYSILVTIYRDIQTIYKKISRFRERYHVVLKRSVNKLKVLGLCESLYLMIMVCIGSRCLVCPRHAGDRIMYSVFTSGEFKVCEKPMAEEDFALSKLFIYVDNKFAYSFSLTFYWIMYLFFWLVYEEILLNIWKFEVRLSVVTSLIHYHIQCLLYPPKNLHVSVLGLFPDRCNMKFLWIWGCLV